jgi:hypothetical protein
MAGVNDDILHTPIFSCSPPLSHNGTVVLLMVTPNFPPIGGTRKSFSLNSLQDQRMYVIQTCMRLENAKFILFCILVEAVTVKRTPIPDHLIYPFGFSNQTLFYS